MATGIKLDQETKDRLKALAEREERTPHWIMKKAIDVYLQEQERYWQEREEDMKRYQDILLTGGVPHEDVDEWLQGIIDGKDVKCPV